MAQLLSAKRIVLGLTGGIACYKSAELTRRLQDQGASVQVVMTDAACSFITPTTMQALSGQHVYRETLDATMDNSMAHINLSREADAILIAPCSADFIAKLAHGLADDLLSTLCLARGNCPLIIAPAMNREMWAHPATQRNIKTLLADGVAVWGPGDGEQACGEIGSGRMLDVPELIEEAISFFTPKVLNGVNILMTAGPTEEAIDPIRVISNRSSGKTGYAIAEAAQRAGAKVTLISGPTALTQPYAVDILPVRSARQMHQAVMSQARHHDIFISVAAVADWYIKNSSDRKIKKTEGGGFPTLEFAPNPDILAEVAAMENGPWPIGFAAETDNLFEYAEAKRQRKKLPLIVGNLAQEVMDKDTTRFVLFADSGVTEMPSAEKTAAASALIQEISRRYHSR
ncbi:DNA/pantothenate metabolism flavoprotein [Oligella ureolytica]|uniref:Coenzyme A biosynthesis bifunctional protein CoaBC n=1 Tax=Oligella ureolytica TaxID=90244 RepID=A0A378XDA4_9BURK|nr:bifunctional phosphopantothenoylcysteine decarboxylase/phosphopantothenate--cysteine ligase CoaBC [Oligella ureolytica]QPT40460.1 bifunctional phosphopantothenoylcysteine decarboxylase/phosphopantothenate--cysteine ligase CoaBC [Oligella ureolytica]SUA51190.1 DNA/pantothenate metabolism flavoprotein [Oligella ureolytica]